MSDDYTIIARPNLWVSKPRWVFCLVGLGFICALLSILPTSPLIDEAEMGQGHWSSMLPPLVAVVVAISFRSLVAALSCAFITGAILYYGWNPIAFIPSALENFLLANVLGQFSLYIFGFLFALVGMVHVLYKSGGIQGLISIFSNIAKTARTAQGATMASGLMIFFDDY